MAATVAAVALFKLMAERPKRVAYNSGPNLLDFNDFRNFKANKFLRLNMQHTSTFLDLAECHHVDTLHAADISTAQFTIDGHVAKRKIAVVLGWLRANLDRPNMLWFHRALLTANPA